MRWRYETEADEARLRFQFAELGRGLEQQGVREDLPLRIVIKYPKR